jgi:APA family basic amino acid/polyamine antiporter
MTAGGDSPSAPSTVLARRLTLPLLVLYGLGTTIGAGIYALTGAVVGIAGMWAPVAFAMAALLAAFAALSLAELSSRFPRAGGEAVYVREGFGSRWLAAVVGLAMATAGAISAATVARGFAAYMITYSPLPDWAWILVLLVVLGAVSARGIAETAWLAGFLTLVEIGGLLLVIYVARSAWSTLPERLPELIPPADLSSWRTVLLASVLCFYAFLGFEDMVNVAEEVKDVRRTLPHAIVWTLIGTFVLYVLVVLTAVLAVPVADLAQSEAALAVVYERATGERALLLSAIGALAMSNGALVQIVKSSRVLYGLADQGVLPARLARVHPSTHTPILATVVVMGFVAVLALTFPLAGLAEATSLITLAVFVLVCGALLRVKRRGPAPAGVWTVPGWVPAMGLLVSVGLLIVDAVHRFGTA